MTAPANLQSVQALLGRSVSLVCFAEFSCYVHFDSGRHLRIESAADVQQGRDVWALFPHVQEKSLTIIGKRLRAVNLNEASLNLDLEEDVRLRIDVSGPYESLIVEGGVNTPGRP